LLGHTHSVPSFLMICCRLPDHELYSPCWRPVAQSPSHVLSIIHASLSFWSLVPPPLSCRCPLSLPQMLHCRSSLRCSALALSLALGRIRIRVSVLPWCYFYPPVNAFHHQILINIADQSSCR
jgi:hypothetical protein